MAATASAPGSGGVSVGSFGRGRGRGRGLRVQQQTPQQPGPNTTTTVPTQSTPLKTDGTTPKQPSFETPPAAPTTTTTATTNHCDEVKTIMKKLEGLSEEEVIRKVVPVIEGLDSQAVIQELVEALSEKALDEPLFSCIAAKISQKLWDNESIHQFVRNPLLSRTQSLYSRRKELATAGRYHGLCVYVSELFRVLRIRGRPLRPMCLPVVELMTGLLKGGGAPSEEDVQCFYQQMKGIGAIIMECMQPMDSDAQKFKDQLEELINCARQHVISSSLAPKVRCRLVHVIEIHAGKWKVDEELNNLYTELMKDL